MIFEGIRIMQVAPDHKLFQSRTDIGRLAVAIKAMADNPVMLTGYLLGLEICAGVCRSHIVSAAEKFGPKSSAVRLGRADLCCIEREIRRVKKGRV